MRNTSKQLIKVRSFSQGIKNCYTLRPEQGKGTNYLIKTTFMYRNYDSLNKPPEFDLHLGTDVWDTVKLSDSTHVVVKEMIYTPTTDYLYMCLANLGLGTPFITILKLRLLNSSIYNRVSGMTFDRIWEPTYLHNSTLTSTTTIDSSIGIYRLPSAAIQAAMTPKISNDPLLITLPTEGSTTQYYMFFHFAELQKLSANETREFNITVNGALFYRPYSPKYLFSRTIHNTNPMSGSILKYRFEKTAHSTLPPIVNAMEYFMVKELSQALTDQQDSVLYLSFFYIQ
ncbi:hypothetical protein V2J09_011169 [Rumex salicifolius]